ncbi:MAG: hypothetical protein EAZ72_05085 [Verrucomicrobia bacterium]|nr:MAG: hypothetical protein EAZ72_05085 [Verrucomicrobiota bacterium]
MMTVVGLEGLQDRQPADPGIEDADREIAQVSAIIRRGEAGRDIALRMGLGMADGGSDDLILRGSDAR